MRHRIREERLTDIRKDVDRQTVAMKLGGKKQTQKKTTKNI